MSPPETPEPTLVSLPSAELTRLFHDLRAPLSALVMNAEGLVDSPRLDGEEQAIVEDLVASAFAAIDRLDRAHQRFVGPERTVG